MLSDNYKRKGHYKPIVKVRLMTYKIMKLYEEFNRGKGR